MKLSHIVATVSSVMLLVFLHCPSLNDRCSVCQKIVHTTFRLMMLEDHGIQIAVGMPVEPLQHWYFSQIQAYTN
jgi:hypothetical protein